MRIVNEVFLRSSFLIVPRIAQTLPSPRLSKIQSREFVDLVKRITRVEQNLEAIAGEQRRELPFIQKLIKRFGFGILSTLLQNVNDVKGFRRLNDRTIAPLLCLCLSARLCVSVCSSSRSWSVPAPERNTGNSKHSRGSRSMRI